MPIVRTFPNSTLDADNVGFVSLGISSKAILQDILPPDKELGPEIVNDPEQVRVFFPASRG